MKKFTNALMLGAISIATMVAMASCGNDKEPEKVMAITPIEKIENGNFHFLDTVILSVTDAPIGGGITYQCDNEWVAVLFGDTLVAWHIGDAVITATVGDTKATYAIKVTANPEYNMATEPLTDCYGISAKELKDRKNETPFRETIKDGTGSILYLQNAQTATYEIYGFESDKLDKSSLQVQELTQDIVDGYVYFLSERYIRVTVQGDEKGVYYADSFKPETATLLLQLFFSKDNDIMRIEYRPYSHPSNAPAPKAEKRLLPLSL